MFRCNYIFSRDITRSFFYFSFFLSCRRPTKDRVELFNIRRCDGFVSPVTALDHNTDSVGKSLPGIHSRRAFPLKALFFCVTKRFLIRMFHSSQPAGIFPHVFRQIDSSVLEIQQNVFEYFANAKTRVIYDFS